MDADVGFLPGLKAGVDLDGAGVQYTGVELDGGDHTVDQVDANGAWIVGVLYNKPKSGAAAQVAYRGIVKARAGGAIAANAKVACDADGDFITWATGDHAVGIAIDSPAADQEIFSLLLLPIGLD